MSANWETMMLMPKDMHEPGTMLVNGLPCPTFHVMDEEHGFFVCSGQFWLNLLEALSSTLRREVSVQLTTLRATMPNQYPGNAFSSSRVVECSSQLLERLEDGERGRPRTYNLLIKSQFVSEQTDVCCSKTHVGRLLSAPWRPQASPFVQCTNVSCQLPSLLVRC